MSEIENKSICISSDESSSTLNANDISKLKRISGKDMITSDKKYCPQVSFLSNVKMIIASNYFIEATIADPAFERRRMTIPFQYPIPLEKQDSMLIYKLLNEKDAIVTKAFYSYIRLLQHNFIFSGDEILGGEYDRMHITHNIDGAIHEFVEKYCNTESDTFTPSNYIFEAFIKIYSSFTIQDSEVFFKKLNKFLNSIKIPHYKRRHPDFPNPVNGYFLTVKEV
jgi:phage/plasmid-associated DNA primase